MAFRIVIALVLTALASSLGSPSSHSEAVEAATPAGPRVVGLDDDPIRRVEAQRAIERFAEVGLELPMVMIEFHDATVACHGHDGFIRYVEPAPVITICSESAWVLTHELAHAWIDANLSEEEKADYVERWGLASWDGADDDWNARGTEHAAFAMQQNLTATPSRMTPTWLERAEAFEMLTGVESPLTSPPSVSR